VLGGCVVNIVIYGTDWAQDKMKRSLADLSSILFVQLHFEGRLDHAAAYVVTACDGDNDGTRRDVVRLWNKLLYL